MGDRNDHNYTNLVGWAGCMVGKAGLLWASVLTVALSASVLTVALWEAFLLALLPQKLPLKTQLLLEVARTTQRCLRWMHWLLPFLPTVSFLPRALCEILPKVFPEIQGCSSYLQ